MRASTYFDKPNERYCGGTKRKREARDVERSRLPARFSRLLNLMSTEGKQALRAALAGSVHDLAKGMGTRVNGCAYKGEPNPLEVEDERAAEVPEARTPCADAGQSGGSDLSLH